jgi:hypothetical protein
MELVSPDSIYIGHSSSNYWMLVLVAVVVIWINYSFVAR